MRRDAMTGRALAGRAVVLAAGVGTVLAAGAGLASAATTPELPAAPGVGSDSDSGQHDATVPQAPMLSLAGQPVANQSPAASETLSGSDLAGLASGGMFSGLGSGGDYTR